MFVDIFVVTNHAELAEFLFHSDKIDMESHETVFQIMCKESLKHL